MMKKKWGYLIILITLINISALVTVLYLRWQSPVFCKPGSGFEMVKREVGLSPEQLEKLEVYRRLFHAELDSLDRLLAEDRRRLAQEIRRSDPDTSQISAIVENIGRLQTRSQYRAIEHFFQIKTILSPEQQEKFFNIVLERFLSRRQFTGARQINDNR
ncbi:MAG: periplasmic heavy metal sensor [bacterium]|nr:periplasmic heavy metal sensor [bacterium]